MQNVTEPIQIHVEGNDLIFTDGSTTLFIRPIEQLMKKCKVATEENLISIVNDFLLDGPDEEQVREKFGAGIDDAVLLAVNSFYGRTDLDGMPTVLHALEVGRSGQDIDTMIVGYIHDVVEDTDTTFEDLERMGFTQRVIAAAKLCTRDKSTTTYDEYLQRIINSGNQTAMNVKVNDLSHNLSRGKKTEQKAKEENNEQLLQKIQRINAKHENAIATILKK